MRAHPHTLGRIAWVRHRAGREQNPFLPGTDNAIEWERGREGAALATEEDRRHVRQQ